MRPFALETLCPFTPFNLVELKYGGNRVSAVANENRPLQVHKNEVLACNKNGINGLTLVSVETRKKLH